MKNEEALALVTKTAQLFEEHNSSEADIVAALEGYGLSHANARKLYLYVQSAFSWAVLKNMGVEKFGSDFQIRANDGTTFHVPVAGQQLFTTALALGISSLQHGYTEDIPVSVFEAVVAQSAEVEKTLVENPNAGGNSGVSFTPGLAIWLSLAYMRVRSVADRLSQ